MLTIEILFQYLELAQNGILKAKSIREQRAYVQWLRSIHVGLTMLGV